MGIDPIALLTFLIASFGTVTGLGALYVSFRRANIDEADLMTRLADRYGDKLEKALKRISALERNIAFLNEELTKAHSKLDRAIKMVRSLIKQLVEANIEPLHSLEELEKSEEKE